MTSPIRPKSAGEIVVFHAGDSLVRQVSTWAGRHPSFDLGFSLATSLFEIRTAARRAVMALVDATEDPALAMAALVQTLAELEAHSVAVYTEKIHEGVELFVRTRGSLLLLGPLGEATWEGLFEGMLKSKAQVPHFGFIKQRRTGSEARRATAGLWEQRSVIRHSAGRCRPKMRDWRR